MASHDRDAVSSELFDHYMSLAEAGRAPDFEAFVAEHAEHAEALRRMHSEWRGLESLRRKIDVGSAQAARERAHAATALALSKLAEHSARGARYQLRGDLGKGGMGVVHEVWDDDLRRTLAMKVVREDLLRAESDSEVEANDHLLQRFLEEAQVTAQLGHPGIVPVHEIGVDAQGRPFFTMTRVKGEDLSRIFANVRAEQEDWNMPRALSVLQRVCETMAFAHTRGVVHRDLKPANVMVGAYGEVYVMDWGLARVAGARGEAPISTDRRRQIEDDPSTPLASIGLRQPGTVFYMSPEQAANRADEVGPLSDVYAVGAMLYELLSGCVPYKDDDPRRTSEDVRRQVIAGPPRSLELLAPEQPPELLAICNKAMARKADQRYADMLAMAADLRAYLEGRVVSAHRTGAWVELTKWITRNKATAAAITIGAAALLATLTTFSIVVSGKNTELSAETARANEQKSKAEAATIEARAKQKDADEQRATAERAKLAAQASEHEAQEQRKLARAQLAETKLRSARLFGQRGQWRDALVALADARAAGYPDEVALRIEEAGAHSALVELKEAAAIVDALMRRDDLGVRRGEVLLMRADFMMSDEKQQERALELVQQALGTGLPPADECYARALLAETVPDALDWVRRAREHDPFHFHALLYEPMLLFFLGRLDEAFTRSEVAVAYYPEDPSAPVLQACVFALRGNEAAMDAAADKVEPLVPPDVFEKVQGLLGALTQVRASLNDISVWLGGAPVAKSLEEEGNQMLARYLGSWAKQRRGGQKITTVELLEPSLPALRKSTKDWMESLLASAYNIFQRPGDIERKLRASLAVLPEGTLYYFQAVNLLTLAGQNTVPLQLDYLRLCEQAFRDAYETPSLIPGVGRAARFWAAQAELLLGKNDFGHDDEMAALAYRNIDWILSQPDATAGECGVLIGHILRCGLDPAVAARLADCWERLEPENPSMLSTQVSISLARGAPGRALDYADRLLDLKPGDADACALREQALDALRALADSAAAR